MKVKVNVNSKLKIRMRMSMNTKSSNDINHSSFNKEHNARIGKRLI